MRKLWSIASALLLAASQSWAAGELPLSGEKLAEAILSAYDQLESYCDRGEETYFASRRVFERCYTATGYYKIEEQLVGRATNRSVRWGGPAKEYRWTGRRAVWWTKTLGYQERPAGTLSTGKLPNDFATRVVGRILRDSWRESLRANLAGFVLVPDYLDQDLILLRKVSLHRYAEKEVVQELWLRRLDHLVWRYKKTFDGRITDEAHLKSVRANDPASLDLDFKAPLTARYSLSSRPVQYVLGITAMAALIGLLVRLVDSFIRRATLAERPPPRLWTPAMRVTCVAFVMTIASVLVFGVLTWLALSITQASGSAAMAIAYLGVIAVFALLVFLVTSGFLCGLYAGDVVVHRVWVRAT